MKTELQLENKKRQSNITKTYTPLTYLGGLYRRAGVRSLGFLKDPEAQLWPQVFNSYLNVDIPPHS